MKKQAFFSVIILFLILSACSKPVKERIIGKWTLTKVGKETLSASDPIAKIEFTKEGKLLINVDGDSSVSKWELSQDEKAIVLVNEKNERKNWNLITVSEHQLVYVSENDTSTLTK